MTDKRRKELEQYYRKLNKIGEGERGYLVDDQDGATKLFAEYLDFFKGDAKKAFREHQKETNETVSYLRNIISKVAEVAERRKPKGRPKSKQDKKDEDLLVISTFVAKVGFENATYGQFEIVHRYDPPFKSYKFAKVMREFKKIGKH